MASTYSDLKIELIGTGDQAGTWGATTNTNLGTAIQEAITGSADVTFSSADVTLTLTDTNGTQAARHLRLNLTGTSGGARQLILGSGCQIDKLYIVNNGLADDVTIKNTTGTGIVIPAGKSKFVFNNGTNVVEADNVTSAVDLTSDVTGILPVANGGTGTALFVVAGPTSTAKTYTFPDANTTIAGLATTQTFTNKRITPRIGTVASTSSLSVDSNSFDQYNVTALASGLTLSNPSGSPTNGQKLIIRIKDNGTSRALSWSTGSSNSFREIGTVLPTVTTANKTIYVGCVYNTESVRWDVLAVSEEV